VSSSIKIISVCAAVACLAAVTTIVLALDEGRTTPQMSEERRAYRETFSGTPKEPGPIDRGQEMRPKW
jgi:type IV secretion system protein TrbK